MSSEMALGSISAAGGGGGGGNSTQDVLATVLTGYCQGPGEGDDDEGLSHLNSALIHVQRTKRLDEVVAALGPYLTSDDGKVSTALDRRLGPLENIDKVLIVRT